MKLTEIDWPSATIPSPPTASDVAREQTLSTRLDMTPPCIGPKGWRSSSRIGTRARAPSGSSLSHSVPISSSKCELSSRVSSAIGADPILPHIWA